MTVDPHWIEVCLVIVVAPVGIWYLRRINKAVDVLPVLSTKFEEHVRLDDERHDNMKDEIRELRGGLTPARGTRMPRLR